jgi:CBS domain containing-hemolysin-like protein
MSSLSLWLSLAGLVLALGLGVAFSLLETSVLMLNRMRLVQLFADEHPEPTNEQDIFRETKEVYLMSRLGLCATLVVAGLCLWKILKIIFFGFAFWRVEHPEVAGGLVFALACILLPPLYLSLVYAAPRLMVRQGSVKTEAQLPGWMHFLLLIVRVLGAGFRMFRFLPTRHLSLHHRLSKSDLLALVTDLTQVEEPEEPHDRNGDATTAAADETDEADEDELIYNILDMEETLVREVMRPINAVVAVRLGRSTVDDLRDLARRTGYSRFPVYRDRIIDLVGYVSIYDIMSVGEPVGEPTRNLESFVTPAYVVPEFMRVSELLHEFMGRRVQVAIVVDEYGACSGWVTREDVLEEIVGEMEDEFDRRAQILRKCGDDEWLADGSINVYDLKEEIPLEQLESPESQYDTLAGFLLMNLGHMPEAGEKFETDKAVFTVERLEGRRIAGVRITLRPQQPNRRLSADYAD